MQISNPHGRFQAQPSPGGGIHVSARGDSVPRVENDRLEYFFLCRKNLRAVGSAVEGNKVSSLRETSLLTDLEREGNGKGASHCRLL